MKKNIKASLAFLNRTLKFSAKKTQAWVDDINIATRALYLTVSDDFDDFDNTESVKSSTDLAVQKLNEALRALKKETCCPKFRTGVIKDVECRRRLLRAWIRDGLRGFDRQLDVEGKKRVR